MAFSSVPPTEGWCRHYWNGFHITDCEHQVNRIDTTREVIWFVLAAWDEEKHWCGTEFGLGEYDPAAFAFTHFGPCWPDEGLEIPTASWPGPEQGTAIVTTGAHWTGNFVPVYSFCGYAYEPDCIGIGPNPATGFGGWTNSQNPPQAWCAAEYGGMGLFAPGVYACPEGGELGAWGMSFLSFGACCTAEQCVVTTSEGCLNLGGVFFPESEGCDPDPCPPRPMGRVRVVDPGGAPGTYPNILAAVAAADPGDVIELVDYTYTGPANTEILINEPLEIRSQSGNAAACVIDCGESADAFTFSGLPASGSVVDAITIKNGYNSEST